MRKIVQAIQNLESIRTLKQTSQAADVELTHLESILLSILRTFSKTVVLNTGYWRQRIRRIDREFFLLPSQAARLSRLSAVVSELDTQVANHQPTAGVQVMVA